MQYNLYKSAVIKKACAHCAHDCYTLLDVWTTGGGEILAKCRSKPEREREKVEGKWGVSQVRVGGRGVANWKVSDWRCWEASGEASIEAEVGVKPFIGDAEVGTSKNNMGACVSIRDKK